MALLAMLHLGEEKGRGDWSAASKITHEVDGLTRSCPSPFLADINSQISSSLFPMIHS